MKKLLFITTLTSFTFLFLFSRISTRDAYAVSVGKWKQYQVSYTNSSWSGNPFDVNLTATFKTPSGKNLTQFGFYAGDNIWKIYFMPDEIGNWTFTTSSSDSELNGKSGSFDCTTSGLPGPLKPIANENRWKLLDENRYEFPIMVPSTEYLKRTSDLTNFINWAKNTAGARIIGTTLVYSNYIQDEVPYLKGEEGKIFYIPVWDRLNGHYNKMRDLGMGHYIMLYSDDAESPDRNGIPAYSEAELRLFRYLIARFGAYPTVLWDTGIDIGETRSNEWISWFASWFKTNDPWSNYHGIGSRSGGGSGGINPSSATYYSDGEDGDGGSNQPSRSTFLNNFYNRSIPTAYTDRWRQNHTSNRGNWDEHSIRKVMWRAALSGAPAIYVSGTSYLESDYASDFSAAKYGGYVSNFMQNTIISPQGILTPMDSLLASGTNSGNHMLSGTNGIEYVAYMQYGGSLEIDLSDVSQAFTISWYNPRTGVSTPEGSINGGAKRSFSTPDSNDWVLHLKRGDNIPTPTPQPDLPGDGNTDGHVDGKDFIIWLTHFGQNVSGANNGDYDGNNTIQVADYLIWVNNFSF